MTTNDYLNINIPNYYPTMYMDGYSPTQILFAHRRMMLQEFEEQNKIHEIKITNEVKIK